jgi:hypothetical protein
VDKNRYRPRRIDDLEAIAFDVLGYKVRDYYRMAAGEMQTMRANRAAFERSARRSCSAISTVL